MKKPTLSIPSMFRDEGAKQAPALIQDLRTALNGAFDFTQKSAVTDLRSLVGGHITPCDSMLFMGDPFTKESIGDLSLLYLILDAIQSGMPMGLQWGDQFQLKLDGDGMGQAKPVVVLDTDGVYQLFIDRVMELKQ